MSFQDALHVRGSETVQGTSVAAVVTFYPGSNHTTLEYGVRAEMALQRNVVDTPGLVVVDGYDGITKPELQFDDALYPFVAGAVRQVRSQLKALNVHGVNILSDPDQRGLRVSSLQVTSIDRSPQRVNLYGEGYDIDPSELAASGLMAAYYMFRQAKMIEDQGGRQLPFPLRAKHGTS